MQTKRSSIIELFQHSWGFLFFFLFPRKAEKRPPRGGRLQTISQQQRRDKLPYGRGGKKKHEEISPVRRMCTVLSRTSCDAREGSWRGWSRRKKGRSRGERPPPRTRLLARRLGSLGQSLAAESRAKQETDGGKRGRDGVKTGERNETREKKGKSRGKVE